MSFDQITYLYTYPFRLGSPGLETQKLDFVDFEASAENSLVIKLIRQPCCHILQLQQTASCEANMFEGPKIFSSWRYYTIPEVISLHSHALDITAASLVRGIWLGDY